MVCEARVIGGGVGRGGLRRTVLLPTNRTPEDARDGGAPEMVMAGLPGRRLVSAIEKPVGLAVKELSARVKIPLLGGADSVIVLLPMATMPEPMDRSVPATVIGASPGLRVVSPIAISLDGPTAVKILPPTVAIGDVVVAASLGGRGKSVNP